MAWCKKVGRITGNPLDGLCERMCIEVRQVFDACLTRRDNASFTLTLTDFTPGTTPPFTYVGLVNYDEPRITNLTVDSAAGEARSRVTFDLNIPVSVNYTDSEGRSGVARSVMTLSRDLLLRLPSESLAPYQIEAVAAVRSSIGSFISEDTVNFVYCIIDIIKVIVNVDILVPTYGYPVYPGCRECGQACPGILNLPLFPENL